jgi:translation initiation factor 2B subunit (eIF-2B alpha/beta/delta family)
MGDPKEITHNYLIEASEKQKDEMLRTKNLHVRYLKYDFTEMSAISMILCEIGRVNPVSVPVVIDEFNAANEDNYN